MIELVLAGEPKGKGRPRFSRVSGRAYTPAATASYEGALRFAGQQAMGSRLPLDGALRISIEAHVGVPKSWPKKKQAMALAGTLRPTGKPDGDNLAKTVDAFNEIIWRDDSQIVDWQIGKFYSDRPRLVVRVETLAPDFME
jgi:Holliday junction resolvase RusA-like endonuclease